MTKRFYKSSSDTGLRNLLISLAVFLIVILCFYFAVDAASAKNKEQERSTLETAVQNSITHCYAIEGSYPESIQYLKDNYGLTYNEKDFYVAYEPLGSDIMPEVTIIEKK